MVLTSLTASGLILRQETYDFAYFTVSDLGATLLSVLAELRGTE